jgi:hypothetical protein
MIMHGIGRSRCQDSLTPVLLVLYACLLQKDMMEAVIPDNTLSMCHCNCTRCPSYPG